jgi:hypothetical protein
MTAVPKVDQVLEARHEGLVVTAQPAIERASMEEGGKSLAQGLVGVAIARPFAASSWTRRPGQGRHRPRSCGSPTGGHCPA